MNMKAVTSHFPRIPSGARQLERNLRERKLQALLLMAAGGWLAPAVGQAWVPSQVSTAQWAHLPTL